MTAGADIDSLGHWLNEVRQAVQLLHSFPLTPGAVPGPLVTRRPFPEPDDQPAGDGSHTLTAAPRQHQEQLCRLDEGLRRLGEWANVTEDLSAALLQAYEQLNILYDVTHQAARVTSSQSLLFYAVSRLAQALGSDLAGGVDPQRELHLCSGSRASSDSPSAQLSALPDHVQEQVRRALVGEIASTVLAPQPGAMPDGRSWLIQRVGEGEHLLGVAFFAREGREFGTPELSLAESALAHTDLTLQNVRLHEELRAIALEVVRALVRAIDKKDSYTAGHSERVAEWAAYVGQALELSCEQVEMLHWSGLLHDVGKIGIPDEVLTKPGKLTAEEFEHVKQHPRMSYEILEPVARLKPILEAVRHHHESWDGTGYPDQLKGQGIPLLARIVQLADVFDALTSTRSYRQAYSLEQAIEIMRQDAGQRLDPGLVARFEQIVERAREEQPTLFRRPPESSEET